MQTATHKNVDIRSISVFFDEILSSSIKDSFSIISAIGKIINAKTEVASVLKIFDRDDHSSAREDLSAFNGLPTCQFKIWNPGGWLSSNNNK